MRMFKWVLALTICLCALSSATAGLAEDADDLTPRCTITSTDMAKAPDVLTDHSYKTYVALPAGGAVQLELPAGVPCGGLYVNFWGMPAPYRVQRQTGEGVWETLVTPDPTIVNQWIPLKAETGMLRIVASGDTRIAEVCALGMGKLPDWVQTWHYFTGKADLLLVVAHPDDELVFLGGTLPYYCGQRGKKTLVVYMTTGYTRRRNELLDGLWTCGVRDYPELFDYRDGYTHLINYSFDLWGGRDAVYQRLTAVMRRFQPDVVVTLDVRNGEDKHGMHRAAADAAVNATRLAADAAYAAPSAPWQVKKLYLHLYPENRVIIPWDQLTLSAFGGRTAADVAKEAFRKHVSQQKTRHKVYLCNPYDSKDYGLYFSTVGEDRQKNDFFENIDPATTAAVLH